MGITLWGYWGAAIGTACATITNTVFMNLYYRRQLSFKIISMFIHIFGKTWICAAIATICTLYTGKWFDLSWISIIVRAFGFMLVYALLMLCIEMDAAEKNAIKRLIKRV